MNHCWQEDWIDITPEQSKRIYSCTRCEYMITVAHFLQGNYAMFCKGRPRSASV